MALMKIYSIAEIAEATGDKPKTVSQWYARGKLPKPDWLLKIGPVWKGTTIGPWISSRRRDKAAG
jgi:hypothetical protein